MCDLIIIRLSLFDIFYNSIVFEHHDAQPPTAAARIHPGQSPELRDKKRDRDRDRGRETGGTETGKETAAETATKTETDRETEITLLDYYLREFALCILPSS